MSLGHVVVHTLKLDDLPDHGVLGIELVSYGIFLPVEVVHLIAGLLLLLGDAALNNAHSDSLPLVGALIYAGLFC